MSHQVIPFLRFCSQSKATNHTFRLRLWTGQRCWFQLQSFLKLNHNILNITCWTEWNGLNGTFDILWQRKFFPRRSLEMIQKSLKKQRATLRCQTNFFFFLKYNLNFFVLVRHFHYSMMTWKHGKGPLTFQGKYTLFIERTFRTRCIKSLRLLNKRSKLNQL